MQEERKSYVILRDDGLVVHTKPITREEAEWLFFEAYKGVRDRRARIRYLKEYGNVLNVSEYADFLERLDLILYYNVVGIYGDHEEFEGRVRSLLNRGETSPEVRLALEGLLDKVEDFLQRPVRPRPIGPRPVRYLEMEGRHVTLDGSSGREEVTPRPMWYEYDCGESSCDDSYGISVFKNYLWLWREYEDDDATYIVAVRRDAADKDVIAALANDNDVQEFLRENADDFRELLREHEKVLIDKGYEDVVRKAKLALTTLVLLDAGRREEGEALPA